MNAPADPAQAAVSTTRWTAAGTREQVDRVAIEEPLEIRLVDAGGERPLTITLRTPGHDRELALGWLYAEGIVNGLAEIASVASCSNDPRVVRVTLASGHSAGNQAQARHFVASAACGLCGKASLEALAAGRELAPLPAGQRVAARWLAGLPGRLRAAQQGFASTGGLHAAGAFVPGHARPAVFEDIGRHNAVDKLVGAALFAGRRDLGDSVLMLSGRAGYELVQKAAAARIAVVAAIGAPSSLAVELARRLGMTLLGFVREDGFNVYAGAERIEDAPGT